MKITTYWQSDRYKLLVNDCKSTFTEAFFTSNWVIVEAYHTVGQRLREESQFVPVTDLVHYLAENTSVSERKLWYAVQLYDKFPDIDKLPEGKAITMNKVITKYLPDSPKTETQCQHQFIMVKQCLKCKAILPLDKPDTS